MIQQVIAILCILTTPLVVFALDQKSARRELEQKKISFTQEAFIESVKLGKIEQVNLFLAAGMHPNPTGNKISAMTWAAGRGHTEIIKLLLAKGADVCGGVEEEVMRPLDYAAANGHLSAVQLLLQKNAQKCVTPRSAMSPLQFAAGNGHPQIVKLLLEKDVEALKNNKVRSMTWAAERGHFEVLKLLVEHGVDVNEIEIDPAYGHPMDTALIRAASMGRAQIVSYLLEKGADPNIEGSRYKTALAAAAANGSVDMVKRLLDLGARGGEEALREAARSGNVAILKGLIESGIDVNAKESNGATALHEAAYYNKVDAVRLLIENGADSNVSVDRSSPSYSGFGSALTNAVLNGYQEIIQLLLQGGADPNRRDWGGKTPLMSLAEYSRYRPSRIEIAKLLLEHGADPNAEDEMGKTALTFAMEQGNTDLIGILSTAGKD